MQEKETERRSESDDEAAPEAGDRDRVNDLEVPAEEGDELKGGRTLSSDPEW
jgi:hypothetical protein